MSVDPERAGPGAPRSLTWQWDAGRASGPASPGRVATLAVAGFPGETRPRRQRRIDVAVWRQGNGLWGLRRAGCRRDRDCRSRSAACECERAITRPPVRSDRF